MIKASNSVLKYLPCKAPCRFHFIMSVKVNVNHRNIETTFWDAPIPIDCFYPDK